jgi:hypothetical protein
MLLVKSGKIAEDAFLHIADDAEIPARGVSPMRRRCRTAPGKSA